MDADDLVARLRSMGTERDRNGMARFGINVTEAAGVSVTALRRMAGELPRDHALAAALWATGLHEARIMASLVDEPQRVTVRQMDAWARDFDSWDLCDQCCANLFWRTPFADRRSHLWATRRAEFVKRAGFALMASAAVKDRTAPDERFLAYLPAIEREATDPRNFVRKAVNWALRQIGKRNASLHRAAVTAARRIARIDDRTARWVASDALRELTDPRTMRRLR
jgi:3-methyladenine DNA glycosylase AlkD